MKAQIEHLGKHYRVDFSNGIDLSSSLGDKRRESKAWFAKDVVIKPFQGEGWVGSVKEGSSVNYYDIEFNPHGNGTHTECYGHIAAEHAKVEESLSQHHLIAYYLRLEPRDFKEDKVVFLEDLKARLKKYDFDALIVQTLEYSANHDFSGTNPTYFQEEFMAFLADMGVKHFLTDLPSVDREEDAGALAGHRAFWSFPHETRKDATITELCSFPKKINEGYYLLNLQLAPFYNDASPSRPMIFPLERL